MACRALAAAAGTSSFHEDPEPKSRPGPLMEVDDCCDGVALGGYECAGSLRSTSVGSLSSRGSLRSSNPPGTLLLQPPATAAGDCDGATRAPPAPLPPTPKAPSSIPPTPAGELFWGASPELPYCQPLCLAPLLPLGNPQWGAAPSRGVPAPPLAPPVLPPMLRELDERDLPAAPAGPPSAEPCVAVVPAAEAVAASVAQAHAEGRCRPCAHWHSSKGCRNGAECTFCHSCPPGELKRQQRAKRQAHRRAMEERVGAEQRQRASAGGAAAAISGA